MAKKLLIIESPNKIKTLQKYLGDDYEIFATIGHIRDLSPSGLGFDSSTYEPIWKVPSPKRKNETDKKILIDKIKKLAKSASEILLASDPDREGEAISWHVYEILNEEDKIKTKRVTFNEITSEAVKRAISNPREIDSNWVKSQFTRRILDRMIGYRLSSLLQRTIRAESAGRVQSVALQFIEDREKLIEAFVPEFWWTLDCVADNKIDLILRDINPSLEITNLRSEEGKSGVDFYNEEDAIKVKNNLTNKFILYSVDKPEEYSRSSKEPYKTSSLQMDAVNKLGWNSKKVTSVAQKLYEGVEKNSEQVALISYPRTDSVRLSDGFLSSAKSYILNNYGNKYLLSDKDIERKISGKTKENSQDAHEAIRPTDINITPSIAKTFLSKDEYSLYNLIWVRTVAALMSSAIYKKQILRFKNNDNKFYSFSRQLIFDGYKKIYSSFVEEDAEKIINIEEIKKKGYVEMTSSEIKEHQTKPPARYTQASLISELEKSGVGRPSTYSTMANVVIDRGYATLENRAFTPTTQGREVANILSKNFSEVINKDFTSKMELTLDNIAEGNEDWKKLLIDFWPSFNQKVDQKIKEIPKKKAEETGEMCPESSDPLVYRYSKKGEKFVACSGFPKCKYIKSLKEIKYIETPCPDCNSKLVIRMSKKNKSFIGCSTFPNCKFIANQKEDGTLERIELKKK
jgi:DNA topoisomerase I